VPILLALLDDPETTSRVEGLLALRSFLSKCRVDVLRDTGLDMVFEEAVLPTLLFLPGLTPEVESLQLLEAAYSSLLQLVSSRFPADAAQDGKHALLDKVLRQGVLAGYAHAADHVAIVEVLGRYAELIINEMGINASKHLEVVALSTPPPSRGHLCPSDCPLGPPSNVPLRNG